MFKRNKEFRAGDDLKAVHPLGKSPLIGITPAGSEKEIIIAESETIVEYVCEHFGRELIPKRYPEGKEGVLGAENEDFMRYKVGPSLCLYIRCWEGGEISSLSTSFNFAVKALSLLDGSYCGVLDAHLSNRITVAPMASQFAS